MRPDSTAATTAAPGHRARLAAWVESSLIQRLIIVLIVINAITLGLETSPPVMAIAGTPLLLLDRILLACFVGELAIKLYAHGLRFWRSPWNLFDFLVIAVALIPASGPLQVLRALRVLRVLRLISMLPRLRFVVEALLHAIPGISAIAGLMLILFYVFSVMATGLFGASFPDWFGSIGASMYTLFQIMTLESWSMGIVRPVMEAYPYAWAFFVPFILIATFTILNLFIAIIVDTMQTLHQGGEEAAQEARREIEQAVHAEGRDLHADIAALRAEIGELRRALDRSAPPPANRPT